MKLNDLEKLTILLALDSYVEEMTDTLEKINDEELETEIKKETEISKKIISKFKKELGIKEQSK